MKTLNVILSVAGAAAAGVIAGMLLAPKKGSDTRDDIVNFIKKNCPVIKNKAKIETFAESIADEI